MEVKAVVCLHSKMSGLNAYVVDAVRTPIGRSHPEKGIYRGKRADELLAHLIKHVTTKHLSSRAKASDIDDFYVGCVGQHLEQGKNIARLSWLLAGQPETVPGVTINRLCGSSLQGFNFAALALEAAQAELLLAGGVEHMHHVPMAAALDYSQELLLRYEFPFTQMGLTAERVAEKHGISRKEQDEFALISHKKAISAQNQGILDTEVVALESERDQSPRGDTSLEVLGGLKASFKENGTVTAGNSSPLSDGASLALLTSMVGREKFGLRARAQVMKMAIVGLDPLMMGMGPVPAIERLLSGSGIAVSDIGVFEINEAFASQAIACSRSLGIPAEKLNPFGGAIALGHPLGCTGTRLIATLVNAMERKKSEFGVAAMCIGHGQGIATLLRLSNG
jgi:acetyl-CoA acyltransferase